MTITLQPAAALMSIALRDRLSVLIFHRVLPQADELLPGEPDAARFESLMAWVGSVFRVLPLADAVRRLKRGALPARALCITFDDGYANNLTVAAPILARLGLPATFFVATGFLDGGRMFNDTVIEAVRQFRGTRLDLSSLRLGVHATGSAAERVRAIDAILRGIKYRPDIERAELADAVAGTSGARLPSDLMMTSAQVGALAAMGFELGGHTVWHPILAQLDDAAARSEIEAGRARLERLGGRPVTLFAYPNGRPGEDYSARTVRLVESLGFEGAVTTSLGAARPVSDPFQIPRFAPWSRHGWRLLAQLAANAVRVRPVYVQAA